MYGILHANICYMFSICMITLFNKYNIQYNVSLNIQKALFWNKNIEVNMRAHKKICH